MDYVKHCVQYVGGGGHIVIVYGGVEVTVKCIKGYYEWLVYNDLNQVAGEPVGKLQQHNVDRYKYIPEASERAAYLVLEYLEKIEKHEHENHAHEHVHTDQCNH